MLPSALYQLVPRETLLLVVSPWALAILTPLSLNRVLRLQGLQEATGPLSRFRDQVRRELDRRLIDADYSAMRDFIAPYAKDKNPFAIRAIALQSIPRALPLNEAAACREAIRTSRLSKR